MPWDDDYDYYSQQAEYERQQREADGWQVPAADEPWTAQCDQETASW